MADGAEFTIASLDRVGDGVTAEGVHVAYALPGERVAARTDDGRWIADDVIVAAPGRASPMCPAFGRCGGCVAQHMSPALYAAWKRERVNAALSRAGLETDLAPLVDSYGEGRRRVILHARFPSEGPLQLGFMRRRSHEIVAIEGCPLLCGELAGAASVARDVARVCAAVGKPLDIQITSTRTGLDLDIRGLGAPADDVARALVRRAETLDLARLSVHGRPLIERRRPVLLVDGVEVSPPPGGFLQATEAGEQAIAAAALPALEGLKRVADLYCGSGAFALRLARRSEVLAIDGDASAVAALAQAARSARDRKTVDTSVRDLFHRPLQDAELEGVQGVLFDPPRAGAAAQARALAASGVPVVVSVSCDADTFARDARTLVDGGLKLESIALIDQFRYSPHVELVGVFRRPAQRKKKSWLS